MALQYTYVSNIPQGNQKIKDTQEPIKDNFQDIYDLVGVNHINFNTPDTFGKHLFIDYITQLTYPGTGSQDIALFTMISEKTNTLELFAQYPNNGSVIQVTGTTGTNTYSINPGGGTYGQGFNPSGYQYGPGFWQYFPGGGFLLSGTIYTTYTGVGNGTTITAEFPVNSQIPVFSQIPFNIQLQNGPGNIANRNSSTGFYAAQIVNTTQFNIYNNPNSSGWSATWLAIGQ